MRIPRRAMLITSVVAAATLPLTQAADAAGVASHSASHSAPDRAFSPQVIHTGTGPTGYEVTFRYKDPTAASVQIKGEWYFANLSDISAPASTATSVVTTPGLLPPQWRPGDFPVASPNSTAANWPVISMTRNPDGVWTYTTPLPSGVFSYGFYVNCTSPAQSGCTEVSDPANPPWNTSGSVEPTSQVYVPSDPRFGTVSYSWQAPARGPHGTLTDVTYSSPGHVTPAGKNYLAIYTPPGYDPDRAQPYPTLYLNHGGGGSEVDWSTQGDLGNIMDNLIDTGQIQPMVVVMPNANGYPSSADNSAFDSDLISNIIPYVESHYHVSASASERAFSGLSAGGLITNSLMLYHAGEFGYYGVMSAGLPCPSPGCTTVALTPAQAAALKGAGIFVGGGWQDPVHAAGYKGNDTGTVQEVSALVNAGLAVTPDFINGGHEWYVWRILLRDFLTRVAFFPAVAG
jgi:enterochelin esterase-like enzyme